MAAKFSLILCATTCFIEMISAQYTGPVQTAEELALSGTALAYGPGLGSYGPGIGPYGAAPTPYGSIPTTGYGLGVAPSSGGGFQVTSSSPISPTGITVVSENTIEGAISVNGQLPFLGAIALDGALPSAGASAINYACGTGAIGMVSEGLPPVGAAGFNPGMGYGAPGMGFPGASGPRQYNGVGSGY